MKLQSFLFSCVLALFSCSSFAWNAMGHMLVAQIAYDQLTPAAKKQVDQLNSLLAANYPKANGFIASAPWPDDLKGDDVHLFNTWHYITLGFSYDGTAIPAPPADSHVAWAIQETTKVLRSKNAQIGQKSSSLAMLIHFVGDIHQPTHAATQFSQSHPNGDAGANQFALKGKYKNMHALWDAAVETYSETPARPLSDKNALAIKNEADRLVAQYKLSGDPRLSSKLPQDWAQESHELARSVAYDGIRENDYPSSDYKARGSDAAKERIVLAGYRLAILLNSIFK